MTIHSDLFSELRMASIIFRRLVRSLIFCLLLVFSMSRADLLLLGVEIEHAEQLLDRLGAHLGFEFVAVLFVGGAVFVFGQKLLLLQRRLAGIGDDVILEVDDLFDVAGLHVQQRAEAAWAGP